MADARAKLKPQKLKHKPPNVKMFRLPQLRPRRTGRSLDHLKRPAFHRPRRRQLEPIPPIMMPRLPLQLRLRITQTWRISLIFRENPLGEMIRRHSPVVGPHYLRLGPRFIAKVPERLGRRLPFRKLSKPLEQGNRRALKAPAAIS